MRERVRVRAGRLRFEFSRMAFCAGHRPCVVRGSGSRQQKGKNNRNHNPRSVSKSLVISFLSPTRSFEERKSTVRGRLRPPQPLHFFELLWILGSKIRALREVRFRVIQLPAILVETRAGTMNSDRVPTIVPDAAAAPKLEILRVARVRAVGIIERCANAFALKRDL